MSPEDRLLEVACEAGVHDTAALGRCPHSPRSPLSPLFAILVAEGLAALRMNLAATRLINRAYDFSSRGEPDFGPLGSAWNRGNDLGRPA